MSYLEIGFVIAIGFGFISLMPLFYYLYLTIYNFLYDKEYYRHEAGHPDFEMKNKFFIMDDDITWHYCVLALCSVVILFCWPLAIFAILTYGVLFVVRTHIRNNAHIKNKEIHK